MRRHAILALAVLLIPAWAGAADTPSIKAGVHFTLPMTDGTTSDAVIIKTDNPNRPMLLYVVSGRIATLYLSADESAPVPPTPTPPAPDLTGLAKDARDWAALVPAGPRTASSKALAASFESVAAMIAAGTLKDATAIQQATATSNNQALGANVTAWQPWLEKCRAYLNAEGAAGRMTDIADIRKKWLDIAEGLKAVK